MLDQLLNHKTRDRLTEISQEFSAAEPFKYVVIDDFFEPQFCQQLLNEFPQFKAKDSVDENQTLGKKAVVQSVAQLGSAFKQLDQLVQSETFLKTIENITGIQNLIYDPHYIGGGTHNNLNAQELDPHVDFTHHPITSHHRRLNLIVYLNHEWEADWGGSIEFHKNPRLPVEQDHITRVLPLFNRAVIFETNNHSWHGFPPISLPADKQHLTRKSFALYYYTHQRDTSTEPHSTIYVERPLAEKFKPGMHLNDQALSQLKTAINRRDQHLERLYNTITSQTKQISQLQAKVATLKNLGGDSAHHGSQVLEKLEQLNFDETRLLNRVQELENSTSWKVTAPLRKLKRWLSRNR